MKIRLLLDARKLGDGGIGVYLERLIEGLALNSHFKSKGTLSLLLNKKTPLSDKICSEYAVGTVTTVHRPYSMGEFIQLGRDITCERWDLFHTPHYPLPLRVKIPSVVTIHDIIHLSAPERWYYPLITGPLLIRSLYCATEVITVSEASRKSLTTLSRFFSMSGRKIHLIPNAVPVLPALKKDHFLEGSSRAERSDILAVLSNSKPHKGLGRIIEAFLTAKKHGLLEAVCSGSSSPAALILAGYAFKDDKWRQQLSASLLSAVDNGCAKGIIKIYGALPSDLFKRLYQKARLLVVGSSVEGFCIPVIEAHAAGVPVVTTPVPAITELLGKADTVSKDFSSASLADALASAWVSDSAPEPLHRRFSIASVAEQTLRVYESALQSA